AMRSEQRYLYEFGPYRVDPAERRLLRGDIPVPLTPKAFETLLVLVENAGRSLEKDELLRRVWPDTFVEEGSLTRNISVLRKVLGDVDSQYIETIPKRGYRFVAPIKELLVPGPELVVDEQTLTRVVIEETEAIPRRPLSLRLAVTILLPALVVGIGSYMLARREAGFHIKSLAVLPLKSLDGGAAQRHLELGLADNIIGHLSQISGLTVRPTGAGRRYVEFSTDQIQAARELKVDLVLDGTLQTADGRLHINLNLLQTNTGASIWTQAFEAASVDILNLEDTIARQVASQLRGRLGVSG